MNILAIVPARGGSKGIPKKNIKPFCGKPLLAYSIEAAKQAGIPRIIVDTDSPEIADVAKQYGAEVPFLRPPQFATDSAKIIDSVEYLLGKLKADEGYEPTHVLLLQPTSPMRTAEDIQNAIALMEKRGAHNVISICRTESLLLNKDQDDKLIMLNEALASANRQEAGAFYKFDGSMIYLIETTLLLKEHSFAAGNIYGYEIERWRAIDLDYPEDFVLGELIYQNREALAARIKNFN
jgi:CMP-N,N'-diacetyllegionaminic acid synthase